VNRVDSVRFLSRCGVASKHEALGTCSALHATRRVARLGNRMTIALTGRLAITNSGCNAHVFHHVMGS